MDSRLKQRLIGAAVLVALAVIFLPMLVKGPAPDSGVSDLSMRVPDAPQGDYKTVDLPLVAPPGAGDSGVLDMPEPASGGLPTVDTATADPEGEPLPDSDGDGGLPAPAPATPKAAVTAAPLPPSTAAGNYVVHFGAFATAANAQTILKQIRDTVQLEGYSEPATINDKPAYRVRIGPYATRAQAEAVRLRAAQVRDDVMPRVLALDAQAPARPTAAAAPATPAQTPAKPIQTEKPASTTAAADTKPATPPPASTAATATPTTVTKPAAAGVGFVVQVSALKNAADATALRDRLRGQGIAAFTDTVDTDNGRLTRVKAGPVASREDADRLKSRVKSAVGIDGMVRQHP